MLYVLLALPWCAPLGAVLWRRHRWWWYTATTAAVLGLSLWVDATSAGGSGVIALAGLNRILVPLVLLLALMTFVASREQPWHVASGDQGRFFFWLHGFAWSLLLVAMSQNLGVSWLGIELTTITSAMLVALPKSRHAIEAAWKYVILCSVGLLLAVLGILFLVGIGVHHQLGVLNVLNFNTMTQLHDAHLILFSRISLVLMAVGFGTKVGFAPLHSWLPDAHSESPAPVSALMSAVLLGLVLTVLWRTEMAMGSLTGASFGRDLLIGFGVASLALAVPFLLVQTDIKRLLAYSSVEQMGLIAIGFGIGGRLAITCALVQLVMHALVKSGLFFVSGDVLKEYGSKRLGRVQGLLTSHPLQGVLWCAGILTLVGAPPLPMFLSELGLVVAAWSFAPWLGVSMTVLLALLFAGLTYYLIDVVYGQARKEVHLVSQTASWVSFAGLALALPLGLWLPNWLPTVWPLMLRGG